VHEDADAIAFMDLHPIQEGHALVIPRSHIRDLASCPPELAGHLFAVAGELGRRLVRVVDAEGFNVWTANGRAAGQEVFHLHLHVLPRFPDDAFGLRFPQSYPQEAARDVLNALALRVTRDR
jgi:histidine triad (HIT) family protein